MVSIDNTEAPLSTLTSRGSPQPSGVPISNSLTVKVALRLMFQDPCFLFSFLGLRPQEQYWVGDGVDHLLLALIMSSPTFPINYSVSDWILMGSVFLCLFFLTWWLDIIAAVYQISSHLLIRLCDAYSMKQGAMSFLSITVPLQTEHLCFTLWYIVCLCFSLAELGIHVTQVPKQN